MSGFFIEEGERSQPVGVQILYYLYINSRTTPLYIINTTGINNRKLKAGVFGPARQLFSDLRSNVKLLSLCGALVYVLVRQILIDESCC